MKHGVAFRKFSRTSSHRMLMLRNLVTSLLEHEQIQTTLPKAKDAARLADKIITMGKKSDYNAFRRAQAFLLKPDLTTKLFKTYATRYANRPGGYTRVHKFGNREGDNAPMAIVELVDNPNDIRAEMTARAVGWEVLRDELKAKGASLKDVVNRGVSVGYRVASERDLGPKQNGTLRPLTRWNLQRVLKYKDEEAVAEFEKKAENYIDRLLAKPMLAAGRRSIGNIKGGTGWTVPGEGEPAMRLAQGALKAPRRPPGWLAGKQKPLQKGIPLRSISLPS